MKLLVGLGNPGREYHWTRHNMGFLLIDELARENRIPITRRGLKSVYGRGQIAQVEVILAKPQTFMNRSGEAVQRLLHFFKIPIQDLIVLQDDLDLPWGKIRIRLRGSSGGHRGIESIREALGSGDFVRVKIGIGRPGPPNQDPADYVLDPLERAEREEVKTMMEKGAEAVTTLLSRGAEEAMNRYHREKVS